MTAAAPDRWILTGLSGAGKATAVAALVRAGVPVTDNLAPALLDAWVAASPPGSVVVVDARHGDGVAELVTPAGVAVIFLDAADPELVRRNSESTAPHPAGGTGLGATRRERDLLAGLRAAADTVIDTTESLSADLGARVVALVTATRPPLATAVGLTISSFGYKFGIQAEADWVVDVRFLRNPFWDPDLRAHTGLEVAVQRYVLDDPASGEFLDRLEALLRWLLGEYATHRRRLLHLAFGCTGGRHRSVTVAEEMARRLAADQVTVTLRHRDVDKPDHR